MEHELRQGVKRGKRNGKSKAKDQYTPLVGDQRRTRWTEDKEVATGMVDGDREEDGIRDITAKVHAGGIERGEMEALVCHD